MKRLIPVLAVAMLIAAIPARSDTLEVTQTVPFETATVYLSFDWNTVNDRIFNATATDGFSLSSITINSTDNAIHAMNWLRPDGDLLQQDAEFDVEPGQFEILPTPGVYNVIIFESCGQFTLACLSTGTPDFGATATVTELHGNPHNHLMRVDETRVPTPEPAAWLLLLFAGCLYLCGHLVSYAHRLREIKMGILPNSSAIFVDSKQ